MPLPGTNPYVRTDQNGHSCRSHIKIAVCKGYCLSQEVEQTSVYSVQNGSKLFSLVKVIKLPIVY